MVKENLESFARLEQFLKGPSGSFSSECLSKTPEFKQLTESIEHLQLSEERYRIASEITSDYAYCLRVMGPNQFVNEWITPVFSQAMGYSLEEVETIGSWLPMVHSDDLAVVLQHLARISEGCSDLIEYRIVTRSGKVRWLRTYARPHFDLATKQVTKIYGASQDITEKVIGRLIEKIMHQIDQMVLQQKPINEILSLICSKLVRAFGYLVVWVGMKETNGLITVRGADGVWAQDCLRWTPLRWDAEPEKLGLAGRAINTGQTQIAGPKHSTLWHWRRAGRFGARISIAVPLQARGQVIGALNIFSGLADEFDSDHVAMLESFAARIAVALLVACDQQQLRLQGAALESAANAIFITNQQGNIEWVNPAFTRISGYTAAEVAGLNPRFLNSGEQSQNFFQEFWKVIQSGQVWHGELINRRKDGSLYTAQQTVIPLLDHHNAITHYVAIQEDMTEQKQEVSRMAKIAYYDPLTDLPNRVLFNERLRQAIAQAEQQKELVAVLFVDLDRFKRINDSMGHDAGDTLINQVAKRLTLGVRKTDSVCRLGGDEFTIILQNIPDLETAKSIAEKLVQCLAKPYLINGSEVQVTASIGVAFYPFHATEPETLIHQADVAMYRAKAQGKNSVSIYDDGIGLQSATSLTLENAFLKAMAENQLVLHYQLIQDMKSGLPVGVEALIRWNHPDLGLLLPDQFISIAEESGMIIQLGEWALRTACQQIRKWESVGYDPIRVAVNFSSQQFKQPGMIQTIERILQETHLNPNYLEIEITESTLMQDTPLTLNHLTQLKNMGVCLAIDDFGTGYSSLSYLKHFPLNHLKIDRSFICELGNTSGDQAIVKTIIDLSHRLGLQVIAEGVEHQHQVDFLMEHGCDEIQGFIYSKPLPPDELTLFLPQRLELNTSDHPYQEHIF